MNRVILSFAQIGSAEITRLKEIVAAHRNTFFVPSADDRGLTANQCDALNALPALIEVVESLRAREEISQHD